MSQHIFHAGPAQAANLGHKPARLERRAALVTHFEAHAGELDEDAKRRLHSNPLRILDTKNPAMQALVEAAPKLADHLGEASRAHLAAVRAVLDAADAHAADPTSAVAAERLRALLAQNIGADGGQNNEFDPDNHYRDRYKAIWGVK